MSEPSETRALRMEEAAVALFSHAINRPPQNASQYAKQSWHRDLYSYSRRYARAVHNLTRNK